MLGIEHFEVLVEKLIERVFGSLFPVPMHWSDLIRDVARAMEGKCLITGAQLLFPDRYRVVLHPADWESLGDGQEALLSGLYQCLYRLAQEAGGHFVAPPSILLQLEPRMSPGRAEVHASWSDGAGFSNHMTRATKKWIDNTRPADPTR
ncbi:MAG: FhaA domain-containing protein [Anaerolineae bacterium]